jgi:hypothetical protein
VIAVVVVLVIVVGVVGVVVGVVVNVVKRWYALSLDPDTPPPPSC